MARNSVTSSGLIAFVTLVPQIISELDAAVSESPRESLVILFRRKIQRTRIKKIISSQPDVFSAQDSRLILAMCDLLDASLGDQR